LRYKNLENNNQYICVECNKESVIDGNGNCLANNADLIFCKMADNFSTCNTCLHNYVKVKEKCTLRTIENCVDYVENPSSEILTCAQCENGYGL